MPTLWEAFIEDYHTQLVDWSLKFTLEAFWHYCQDGSRECDRFLEKSNAILTSAIHSDGEGRCLCEVVHGHRRYHENS